MQKEPKYPWCTTPLNRVDITSVEGITGISEITAMTVYSEIGDNLNRFKDEKHFTSWLGLAPNNKISSGKIISCALALNAKTQRPFAKSAIPNHGHHINHIKITVQTKNLTSHIANRKFPKKCTFAKTCKSSFVNTISSLIINWFRENKRPLPWRKERNAYHILLSEVIMQQTRMEQGLPYFFKIVEAFPTVEALAAADEELLLRHWQGLGYYSRARNLHATAKNIVENYNGLIPNSFSELKKLKGVGDYTAAAIASIVFDEPVPVVDGNVMRVVARLFAIEEPVNETIGKNKIRQRLDTIFDAQQPGIFNEAIMEFGALQCVPSNPDCGRCPVTKHCAAYITSKVNLLPAKSPAKEVKTRYLNYLVLLIDGHSTLMRQRRANDIWKNLYEFPLIETEQQVADETLCEPNFWMGVQKTKIINRKECKPLLVPPKEKSQSAQMTDDGVTLCALCVFFAPFAVKRSFKTAPISFHPPFHSQHKLTHRLLNITFTVASVTSLPEQSPTGDFTILTLSEAESKPKPVPIAKFLKTIIQKL